VCHGFLDGKAPLGDDGRADVGEHDVEVDKLVDVMEDVVKFLDREEVELMFFRFIQGNSFKTLKKTMRMGSTKTAAKRTRKLAEAIRYYAKYFLGADYERDMKVFEEELGADGRKVAEMLFRRMSKHAILKSPEITISNARLTRTLIDIEILCISDISLEEFWNVITKVGKFRIK